MVNVMTASPEDGDVIVDVYTQKEGRESTLVYVQNPAPDVDQHLFRAREEAVEYARAFAKCQHACAWLTDNWFDFVVLEDFRVVEVVQTSEFAVNDAIASHVRHPATRNPCQNVSRPTFLQEGKSATTISSRRRRT